MTISAEYVLDVETLSRGRHWHWKSYHGLQCLWVVAGLLLIASGGLLLTENDTSWGSFFFVFGLWCLLRKWILGLRSNANWKKIPGYGQPIRWQFDGAFLRQSAGESTSQIKLSELFLVRLTPDGFLLYPQKGLFYWLPSSAFPSNGDFDAAALLLKQHAKWEELT